MSHLVLLGAPQLETPGGALALERKTAAVLTFLALEGSTPKYKLAGQLWPDSGEETARNNMRQLLRRLRLAAGPIVQGDAYIALAPEVTVDVKGLSYFEPPSLEHLRQNADLLAGYDYDDAPDFAEWLAGAREELRTLRLRASDIEAARLERQGNFRDAIVYAALCLKIEPLSEEAHRRVMRLHYLLGDRAAALAAFARCRRVLAVELETEPLPETLELRKLIERGARLGDAPPSPKGSQLPTAILRPPVLAGRGREWRQMEEAWWAKKIILVTGEAGSGKTRLVEDFAASKGFALRIDGRPGDTGVPYASQARVLRTLLAQNPELKPGSGQLEPWVWRELARLLPEFGDAPPLSQEADRVRFFEAVGRVFVYCTRDLNTVIVDDLQFYDDHTVEVAAYYQSQPYAQAPGMPPHITIFRKGELSKDKQAIADQLVEAGLATLIELEPLEPPAVETLLSGLALPDVDGLAPGLFAYTGGNPLFILETLRHLIETGTLEQGLPARLSPQGRVAALINRRLQRLSHTALNLARAAAVAGTRFDLSLAGYVLERPPLELAEAHAELEEAQVLCGYAFSHDLLYEAVLAGLPAAVRRLLHARTAQYFEAGSANPGLVAYHLLEAGEIDRAVPQLLSAGARARAAGLFEEAADLLERAITLFNQTTEPDARAATLRAALEYGGEAQRVWAERERSTAGESAPEPPSFSIPPLQELKPWKRPAG